MSSIRRKSKIITFNQIYYVTWFSQGLISNIVFVFLLISILRRNNSHGQHRFLLSHRYIQGVIACMTRRLVVWSFFSFLYSSVQRMGCLLQFQWRLIFRQRFYWHINNPLPEDYLHPLLSNPQPNPPPPFY